MKRRNSMEMKFIIAHIAIVIVTLSLLIFNAYIARVYYLYHVNHTLEHAYKQYSNTLAKIKISKDIQWEYILHWCHRLFGLTYLEIKKFRTMSYDERLHMFPDLYFSGIGHAISDSHIDEFKKELMLTKVAYLQNSVAISFSLDKIGRRKGLYASSQFRDRLLSVHYMVMELVKHAMESEIAVTKIDYNTPLSYNDKDGDLLQQISRILGTIKNEKLSQEQLLTKHMLESELTALNDAAIKGLTTQEHLVSQRRLLHSVLLFTRKLTNLTDD